MALSLPAALALLAILVAVFALVAVAGVYSRLRQVEQVIADLTVGGGRRDTLPASLRPQPGESATVLLTLDGECPICHRLAKAVEEEMATAAWAGLRVVRVFSSIDARDRHPDVVAMETVADPDVWAAVYEGYNPTLSVVNAAGEVIFRRFVYADTNLTELLAEASAVGLAQGKRAPSREAV
ncbi:hypothetical protein ABZ749_06815 [Micromonospora sp. NPDC047753]|uniref:hypothetical protein n=1 Tax=Micromonospora sp. NPDC047753 TaxID=3154817 RepID=UPI0033C8C907